MHRPPAITLLVRYDWLMLVLLSPVLLYPERFAPPMTSVALAALVALWLIRLWATRAVCPPTVLNVPLLCLMLTVPLSLYASANFASSLPKLTSLLFGVAIFFATARASAQAQRAPMVLSIWFVSVVAISLLSLVTTDWAAKFAPFNELTRRLPHIATDLTSARGGGLHPNEVGGLLALFVPLVLSVSVARWSDSGKPCAAPPGDRRWVSRALGVVDPAQRSGQAIWLLALLLLGGLLVLTQSRSALFGAAVAAVLIGAVRSRRARALIPLAVVVSLVALLVTGPQTIADALVGGNGAPQTAGGSLDLAGRAELWNRALYAVQDFPFTGVGLNQFEPVVNTLYPLFLIGPNAQFVHAHNLILQAAMDFGLGGLIAYVALLSAALVAAVQAYRLLPAGIERSVVLGLAAGLMGHQLYGLTDAIALGAKPTFEWWLLLGLMAGIRARVRRPANPARMRLRVSRLDVFGLWVLMTLLAVALVGDNALLGVGLAVLGGCAVGLSAFIADTNSAQAL